MKQKPQGKPVLQVLRDTANTRRLAKAVQAINRLYGKAA